MIDIDALTAGLPWWVFVYPVVGLAIVAVLTVWVGTRTESKRLSVLTSFAGLAGVVGVFFGFVAPPVVEDREPASAEAEKVLVEAVKDRYEVKEMKPRRFGGDWGDIAVRAAEGDFVDAPPVEVLTNEGVSATYQLLFDNKTGEATLISGTSSAPSPDDLLREEK